MNKKIHLQGILLTIILLVSGLFYASAQTPDPGIAGTHTVIKAEYNLGNTAYTPPAAAMFPSNMEVIGSVHYPADLSSGPFPVIIIEHGRHSTCWETSNPNNTNSDWPCPTGWQSITSYEGYDYLASNMASHGYIVISISANAINAIDGGLPDFGMNARGVLVQHHLDLWNTWNTVGGFPGDSLLFVGALNLKNVGTMGHSRGGQGVVYNAVYNDSLGSPYGIKAVLTLAPVDFTISGKRKVLNGIPLLDVAPYCDGDVTNLAGVNFYDDARYNDTADQSPKHEVLYMGADHDLFNTIWTPSGYPGGVDDWTYSYSEAAAWCGTNAVGSGRLDSTHQKAALLPYFAAFYRVYLGHENQFAPILDVDDTIPPASSLLTSSQVHVSFQPAKMNRLDLNRTDSTDKITTNTLGGSVILDSILSSQVCGGGTPETNCGLLTTFEQNQQPHNSSSASGSLNGLSQMGLQWDTSMAACEHVLPIAYQDLTAYQDISFRTSVNFKKTTLDSNLDFTVQLIDSLGDTASQAVRNYSNALFYQPGTQTDDLPKLLFNTVKIPLSSFTGINMAKVRSVRFVFNKSKKGYVFVSDLAFSNPPCSGTTLAAAFTYTVTNGYHVAVTNLSTSTTNNASDSIGWYWSFGGASSGANDTSTLKNPPVHIFTATGTYTVCLTILDFRKNNFVCSDTFCSTISVSHVGVSNITEPQITIIPNPAKDYIQVNGATKNDVLTLMDLYGRVVLKTTISSPVIYLPHPLATGIYYAMVTTATGDKVYQKLFISQ